MPYIWDEIDEMVKKVKIVGEGILDDEKIYAVRFGPVTEWLRFKEIHAEVDEYLKKRERATDKRFAATKAPPKKYKNTEDRPSLMACSKCGTGMLDVFKIKTQDGKDIKNPKRIDCVCRECGYSVAGVEYPKGPLLQRLTK